MAGIDLETARIEVFDRQQQLLIEQDRQRRQQLQATDLWTGGLQQLFAERRTAKPAPRDLPVPTATALAEVEDGPDEAYAQLCGKLGIYCVGEAEARLESILREEMIPVYNTAAVEAYLANECGKRDAVLNEQASRVALWRSTWAWHPVRKIDRMKNAGSHISEEVYEKPIPYPVLLTMDRIASRMPEAKFFVSEIAEVRDPFLAVTVAKSARMWVVERWDEPGFRDR